MNVSKQNNEDDGTSMYLSFDATISETDSMSSKTKYVTILGDTSSSLTALIDMTDESTKCNTTLSESTEKTNDLSGTMKDCFSSVTTADNAAAPTHLQPLKFSNILKEFNAMSSTPSKSSPLKSPAGRATQIIYNTSAQLGGMGDFIAALENLTTTECAQANKENPMPVVTSCSSTDSMPSFSQTSILNLQLQKQNQKSKTETKTVPEEKAPANTSSSPVQPSKKQNTKQIGQHVKSSKEFTATEAALLKRTNLLYAAKRALNQRKAQVENALKTIKEANEQPTVPLTQKFPSNQQKVGMRKSMCEPDLLLGRPSRIAAKKTRFTLMPNQLRACNDGVKLAAAPSSTSSATLNVPTDDDDDTDDFELTDTDSCTNVKKAATNARRYLAGGSEASKGSAAVKPAANFSSNNNRKTVFINLQPTEVAKQQQRPTPNKSRQMPPIAKTTLNCATRKQTTTKRPSLTGFASNSLGRRRSVLLLQSKLMHSPLRSNPKPRKTLYATQSSSNEDEWSNRSDSAHRRQTDKAGVANNNNNNKYCCSVCGVSYNIKSLFDAHKQTHGPGANNGSGIGGNGGGGGNAANAGKYQCKYCDRSFVLERTLHIHLMEHCTKIPAAERRKLDFHEMDHVKKEETPHFRLPSATRFASGNAKPSAFGAAAAASAFKDPLTNLPMNRKPLEHFKRENKTRVMAGGVEKQHSEDSIEQQSDAAVHTKGAGKMAPPNASKVKKRGALHTGVYRTPSKDIPCKPCKQNFKNVLDYTNHMMMTHAGLDASMNSSGGHLE